MIDELRLMAVFAKTLELGSFRKAAALFHLSPSVISHHISQLEKRLGVTLLYRSTRRLSVTDEGKKLYSAAKAMMAAAEEGLEAMTFYSQEPTGTLNLSMPSILVRSFLTPRIAAFSEKYPQVKLNINVSDEEKDLIQEGIDLAIRIGNLENSGMKSRKIYEIERTLVMSSKLLKSRKPVKRPEELKDQKWIGVRMLPHHRVFTHESGARCKVEFTPSIVVDSVDAAYQLAKAGVGFATPPRFLVEKDLRNGELVEILPQWHLSSLNTYLLWHPNASKTGLPLRFKDFLAQG